MIYVNIFNKYFFFFQVKQVLYYIILFFQVKTLRDKSFSVRLVCSRLRLCFLSSAFLAFFFKSSTSCTIHCSRDMNSAFRLIYSNLCVNSNSEIIFIVFSFQQNKRYPNTFRIDFHNIVYYSIATFFSLENMSMQGA